MSTSSIVRDHAVTPWPLSRDLFDKLVELGEFEGQHVELLEGALVEMTPQGEQHAFLISVLAGELYAALTRTHGRRYLVRAQVPLALSEDSEPEPDLAVVPWPEPGERPTSAVLVVEVAATSQRLDLVHKARLYAAHGVPEYWVVDLARRRVVVHRDPVLPEGDSATGARYGSVERRGYDAPLEVLGTTVRLVDLLELRGDQALRGDGA